MGLDGNVLDFIIAAASFFTQIISVVLQLMTESVESLLLILASIFAAA